MWLAATFLSFSTSWEPLTWKTHLGPEKMVMLHLGLNLQGHLHSGKANYSASHEPVRFWEWPPSAFSLLALFTPDNRRWDALDVCSFLFVFFTIQAENRKGQSGSANWSGFSSLLFGCSSCRWVHLTSNLHPSSVWLQSIAGITLFFLFFIFLKESV